MLLRPNFLFARNAVRLGVAIGGCVVPTIARRHEGRLLGRRLSRLLGLLLVVAAVVLGNVVDDEAVGDAEDEEEPEQVERLQAGQQDQGDVLREPALELLARPVQLEGPDGAELGEERVEDAQVEVVAHVDPHRHEDGKVGHLQRAVDVVEGLGGLFFGGQYQEKAFLGERDSQQGRSR